jgi:hypothetical protein
MQARPMTMTRTGRKAFARFELAGRKSGDTLSGDMQFRTANPGQVRLFDSGVVDRL